MSNFDKAIDLIMAQPPELHYPAYYADLLRKADVPDRNDGDTISRQAAIDVLSQYPFEKVVNCISILEEMPSAQPEIVRCKNCKWKNKHNCTRAVEVWIDDDKFCAWAERRTDERFD